MKGRGENVGTGRGVRPGGSALARGTWALGQVVSGPECILGPAALGDAASSHGQADFLSYTAVGRKREKGSRYQQKGRNHHHLNLIVLSSESHSVPQCLLTCRRAMILLTFLTGALQSSIH